MNHSKNTAESIRLQTAKLFGGPHHNMPMLVESNQMTLQLKIGNKPTKYHRVDESRFVCETWVAFGCRVVK